MVVVINTNDAYEMMNVHDIIPSLSKKLLNLQELYHCHDKFDDNFGNDFLICLYKCGNQLKEHLKTIETTVGIQMLANMTDDEVAIGSELNTFSQLEKATIKLSSSGMDINTIGKIDNRKPGCIYTRMQNVDCNRYF